MSRARVGGYATEVIFAVTTPTAMVAQDVVEAIHSFTVGVAPAGLFGVAASNKVVEVLYSDPSMARVSDDTVEVIWSEGTETGGGSGGTTSFGYAV